MVNTAGLRETREYPYELQSCPFLEIIDTTLSLPIWAHVKIIELHLRFVRWDDIAATLTSQ